MKDANGNYLVRELAKKAKSGEGYHFYPWDKPSKNKIVDKLSYVVPLDKWGWFIGTGFYVDDIEDKVAETAKSTNSKVKKLMVIIFAVAVGVTLIFIFLTSVLSRIMLKNLTLTSNVLNDIAEGEGDLTIKLDDSQSDEIGTVAKNFNRFLGKLRSIIVDIKDSSDSVASGSTELASATEEISSTLHSQSMQVSSVASATEELSSSSREVLDLLNDGISKVQGALDFTNTGQNSLTSALEQINGIQSRVDELGESIQSLSASSDNIGNIMDVINDIADQTNLLALNAAIEVSKSR